MSRKQLLDQCMDLQMFNREAEGAESWMSKRETFLAGEEVGDTLDAVEGLIKRYEDMDKSLQAQVLQCLHTHTHTHTHTYTRMHTHTHTHTRTHTHAHTHTHTHTHTV